MVIIDTKIKFLNWDIYVPKILGVVITPKILGGLISPTTPLLYAFVSATEIKEEIVTFNVIDAIKVLRVPRVNRACPFFC